jgi:hypothetical protein
VLWLTRPPILRPLLAVVALVSGLVIELMPANTVDHPFAVRDLPAGTLIDEDDVEYREVPAGLLEPVPLPATGDRPVLAGEPLLTPSPLTPVPADWWSIELPAPASARPGAAVRLVLSNDGRPLGVEGLVASSGNDEFGDPSVLVAVPPEWADLVAAEAAGGQVTVMFRR